MLKSIELSGFKSFGRKTELVFTSSIAAIVGPNGSGKSNVAEGFRFVLGEQSMKSLRSKKGEDLIWGGSAGMPRAGRAAVRVTFDNSKHQLDLDFPEVVIERVVFRDGANEYLINGSKVRLKDVTQLLAGANIGSSGYHIISQGEADRVLSASPRERREMIEEALGLKLYQHKKAESEKKLEETAQNMEKVQSLSRELAPHLRFLRKQVERIEKAREMADELSVKLADYLAREHAYLEQEGARVTQERTVWLREAEEASQRAIEAQASLDAHQAGVRGEDSSELQELLAKAAQAREAHEEAARELGRAEGALAAAQKVSSSSAAEGNASVSVASARAFASEVRERVEAALAAQDPAEVAAVLSQARERITAFLNEIGTEGAGSSDNALLREASEAVARAIERFETAQRVEEDAQRAVSEQRREEEAGREAHHEAARAVIELRAKEREARATVATHERALAEIGQLQERFEEEVREGIVLIGERVRDWEGRGIPEGALAEDRGSQESRRRDIERLKIKIEEYGAGNASEIMKEYETTLEREQFLARELADLEQSAGSLRQIIEELDAKIDVRFTEGLTRINTEFKNFFTGLFGGGDAQLMLERVRRTAAHTEDGELTEEEEPIAGLSVSVQLPRKKVSGLEVLSGGERALTSIALIFAMSQVNPPPFLILDETDAALDEANARRYSDMVRKLGEKSQLILITHNRATMAAASELYGVTMGSDGVSKLLSVKLEEAEVVAK